MSLSKQKNIINQIKTNQILTKYKTLTQNEPKNNIKSTVPVQLNTNSFRKTGTLKFSTTEKNLTVGDRNLSEGKKEIYDDKNFLKRKSESKLKNRIVDITKELPKTNINTKSINITNTQEAYISPRIREESKVTISKLQQIEKLKQATKIELKIKSDLLTSKNSRKTSEERNIGIAGKSYNIQVNSGYNSTTPKMLNKNTISHVYNSTTSSNFVFPKKLTTNNSENENMITDGSKNSKNALINSHESGLKFQLTQKPLSSSTIKSSNNLFLKKKSVPISVSVTNHVSKNNSKNNSKSSSRVDEKTENLRKKIIENGAKKIGIGIGLVDKSKKHFTSTNSPSNQPLKFNRDNGLRKIVPSIKNQSDKPSKVYEDLLDNMLDESTTSVHSSIREGNYFKREAEKITEYIRMYSHANNDYPPVSLKLYKIGRQLGRGTFGKVNLGLHIATGRLVAIKSFNKKNFTTEYQDKRIYYEIKIMKQLKHNNIVKLYETIETDKYILIVLEYVCGGDLLSFVRKRHKLNEQTARSIFKQIMDALYHIHSNNVVHRDIKLDNILIDLSNNIKICDFGVSRQIRKGETIKHQCGTPAYIAPEILRNEGYEGFGVDIWSAGVVLYAMLSGTVPFKANNMNSLHELILSGTYAPIKDISDDAKNLIKGMLEIDPFKRLTVEQVLSDKWLKGEDSKIKTSLFTAAEKIMLSKSNIDYRKAGKDDIIEHFTMRNLNTIDEFEININANTRSHILAPFNSSIIDEEINDTLEIKNENEIFKYCGKAKEANRAYELNNNCEINNGIIITKEDKEEIKVEYEEKSFYNNVATPKDESHRHSKNLIEILPKTNANTYVLDESVLKQVENIGYSKDYLFKCLQNGVHNYATASYYLLLDNHIYE